MTEVVAGHPGWVVGIDVGGTFMKGALLDPQGGVRCRSHRPTLAAEGVSRSLAALSELAAELLAHLPPGVRADAIGVAAPGQIDPVNGIVVDASNLGWRNVPLVQSLQGFGLPVFLEHDVRAAALAELILGGSAGDGDMLFITLGTGIGGALIIDGRVYAGPHTLAGEIGHTIVTVGGDRCACGKHGCLETIASASAIIRRVRDAAGLPVTLTGEEVAAMVVAGHPQASEIWLKAADALALAFANYATVMDPQRIVIGGGLAEAGDLLLEPIRAALAKYLDPAYPVVVERTRLGAIAGYLGAALNARRRLALP